MAHEPGSNSQPTPDKTSNCGYDFSDDNLLALWLEFQQEQAASCPETGAEVTLELSGDPAQSETEPSVRVFCEHCGRSASFKPGPHEGFGWAE